MTYRGAPEGDSYAARPGSLFAWRSPAYPEDLSFSTAPGPVFFATVRIGDFFVSPDERYMVFSSSRPPSLGRGDLFVSFRGSHSEWSKPAHLGDTINTDQTEFCPMVTPDGKYLFFSRLHGALERGNGGRRVFGSMRRS